MIDLRPGQRRALALLMAHGTLKASVLGRMAGYHHKDVAGRVRALRGRGLVDTQGGSKGHSAVCRITDRGRRVAMRLGSAVGAALALAACGGGAEAHELFAGLRSPNGQLCCGDRDCKPVGECTLPGGRQGLAIEGHCTPIPAGTTLGMASPDGQAHACYGYVNGQPYVRCAILPGDV